MRKRRKSIFARVGGVFKAFPHRPGRGIISFDTTVGLLQDAAGSTVLLTEDTPIRVTICEADHSIEVEDLDPDDEPSVRVRPYKRPAIQR